MGFRIIVEGDYACFTRPELKVERVSYEVPSPGALEGLLKSIYWKPAIRYVIDKIVVFNPINFINIRRNEVKNKVSYSAMKNNKDPSLFIGDERTQRASMILKNVKYGIEFHFELTGINNENADEGSEKHFNIIKRRLENGQCFRTPCLGCSEFPVKKISLVEDFTLEDIHSEILEMKDTDLGFMSYGMQFDDKGIPKNNIWDKANFIDKAHTIFYRPHMIDGIIDVSHYANDLRG